MKLQTSGPLIILLGLLWARLPGLGSHRYKGTFHCKEARGNALEVSALGTIGISWLSEGEQTIQMHKVLPTPEGIGNPLDSLTVPVMIERDSLTTFSIKLPKGDEGDSLKQKLLTEKGNYMISTSASQITAEGNGRGKWTILAR